MRLIYLIVAIIIVVSLTLFFGQPGTPDPMANIIAAITTPTFGILIGTLVFQFGKRIINRKWYWKATFSILSGIFVYFATLLIGISISSWGCKNSSDAGEAFACGFMLILQPTATILAMIYATGFLQQSKHAQ